MRSRLPSLGSLAELWSGLILARRTSPAFAELLVRLNRSGRLRRTRYRKKLSPSAWIGFPPSQYRLRRVSSAPGRLDRRLRRRTYLVQPWDTRSSFIEKET